MLSNKLTFSLASLVVLIALVFATTPVMAQTLDAVTNQVYYVGTAITDLVLGEVQTPEAGVTYTYSLAPTPPAGLTFTAGTRTLAGIPTAFSANRVYTYTASGGASPITTTFMIRVKDGPSFPVASAPDQAFSVNVLITPLQLPRATDPDPDDTITYSIAPGLPAGLALNTSTAVVSGTPTAVSDLVHTLTATSSETSEENIATITVRIAVGNAPTFGTPKPTVTPIAAVVGEMLTAVTLPAATDADGTTPMYSISPTLPAGLSFNAGTRMLSGTPTARMASTTYTLTASDGVRSDTLTFMISVTASPAFAETAEIGDLIFVVGTPVNTVLPMATDADLDQISYAISPVALPAGLQFNPNTRAISGTPTMMAAEADYTYTASGAEGETAAELEFTITVNAAAPPDTTAPTVSDDAPTAAITSATMVMLTFSEAVTGVTATPDVAPATGMYMAAVTGSGTAWTVTITPTAAADLTADVGQTVVTFTVTGMDAANNPVAAGTTFSVTLAARTAPTGGNGGNGGDTGTGGDTSDSSGTIAGNGYAVLVHPNATMAHHGIDEGVETIALPNMHHLAEFLDDGGTISLMGPSTATAGSVKITEIMWGTDASLAPDNPIKYSQWIELYNTTGTAIAVDFGTGGGWSVDFDDTYETGAGAIDRVSNLGNPGYWEVKGSSGRTVSTENADAKNLISMYRKLKQINNKAHADHGKDDGNPHRAGTWVESSKPRRNLSGMRVGTPGANPSVRISAATSPTQQVIINEIGNSSTDAYDWVELLNTTGSEINLKKWELNVVMANSSGSPAETQKVSFPDNDNTKLPANGILLITNTPPNDPANDLAAGVEVNKSADDQVKTGVSSLYYVDSNLTLPNSGKYNLILRNANDKEGASTHVVDNGGTYFGAKNDGSVNTEVWPLQATAAGHGDVIDGDPPEDFRAGYVYKRNGKNSGIGEHHWARVGYTGVGYDREADKSDENGGTPGYANDALKEKIADLSSAEITISEIMFDAGSGRRNIAQWIELYNSSMTQAVNLNGWKLEFQNARDENLDARLNATITLGAVTVSPNQTVLIVSTSGLNSGSGEFPPTRLINLWTTHRDDLEMETRNDTVLSGIGFYLELTDKDGKLVDEVGNLDGNRRTADAPAWDLPLSSEEGRRSSIIRRYDDGEASDGMSSEGWIAASSTQLAYAISHTYYGNPDDLGTPGFRGGGPLPVSLSSFRPARDKATGQVVIRWVTQSELNNAGFNILRSETKNGEFKVVNIKGIIPGHGTTSEKHVYTWTDTSAKPNVVYYYQIEDVSLDGNRTTLRTTHLRGNVNAAGKLTTYWGELKTYGK